MQLKLNFWIVLLGCLPVLSCAQSENPEPKSYVAYKTVKPLEIDGIDNEQAWSNVSWSTSFIDIEGVKTPKYPTHMKMLWDDDYLYVLAKMEEPHVWGNLKQRDTIIFYNNDFELFIDPDGDTHNYYEIEINALNTVWDLFITKPFREKGNPIKHDWDITGLKSAVHVDGTLNNPADEDQSWTLEIALPWTAFKTGYYHKIEPAGTFWRINFSRVNWQHSIINGKYQRKKDASGHYLSEYNWVWSPQGVINMHVPEHWGYLYFSPKQPGDSDQFNIPNDERIKWYLYEYYRAQKAHKETHKAWAESLDLLQVKDRVLDGHTIKPTLENHSTGWNITVKSPFTQRTLIVKEDGKFISK
ncbi:carbohydrate-binding family 9-like protein [Seonamhaeicola sp.]|uniref:carbohydrate-binding family 9-like protein n=1 Tax=Seonamhaeicola sp. TaxID=1912245 RepID=UPI00260EB642|nr:carbohydrate-binding family 9-like protein [Seonamhaeicola sp.]